MPGKPGAAWDSLRLQCLERDGYICGYCGNEGNEADHIIPTNKGGQDELSNLITACKKCNGTKQDRTIQRTLYVNQRWLTHV
ncbi:HNH endonuclease [Plantibacter sp. CFBP 8798]|uniref:HNH endonuclease n=1 Tax=Plantibacter sp. CFBP 8798 TaxID=2775268 RepID=UPI001780301A|nr:HNH endonuclease [Plantibacter sp. CFBP 8798]MBD8466801.1 HNH endonuclease [Plantibacter sp. CFBP 8798]